jgi:redox-sensitive bicupin YhaK (pirin superfamily)
MGDDGMTRREALKWMAAAGAAATAAGCSDSERAAAEAPSKASAAGTPESSEGQAAARQSRDPVLAAAPLGFQWRTRDPFLFCVHHDDRYPPGTEEMGPPPEMLSGREMGSDFELRDGFRMYHGRVVPGFPRHPHRGFETVTIVRRGLLDHADSLGAGARYGGGDVQWLTAGAGIQHAEMFPLLHPDRENPLELFQIWLNLPARNKMVKPHFSMLWRETIPTREVRDAAGKQSAITIIAGDLDGTRAPAPPPDSYASAPGSELAIWTIAMEPGARLTLPASRAGVARTLYVFDGDGLEVSGRPLPGKTQFDMDPELPLALRNGPARSELLMLQARPIGEPVARHGPFVMNTREEIARAYADYRSTQFGGWPWDRNDPVHGREPRRFARHADGRVERPA